MAVFTEELADKLKAKGVPTSTLATWRQRKQVPEHAIRAKRYGRTNAEQTKWVRHILGIPFFKMTEFGVKTSRLQSIKEGKTRSLTLDDYDLIKNWVTSFVKRAKRFVAAPNEKLGRQLLSQIAATPFLQQIEERQGLLIKNRLTKGLSYSEEEGEQIVRLFKELIQIIENYISSPLSGG